MQKPAILPPVGRCAPPCKSGSSASAVAATVNRTDNIASTRTLRVKMRLQPLGYATAISTAGATGDMEVDIALTIVTALGAGVNHAMHVFYTLPE